jgi:hypothetical protein
LNGSLPAPEDRRGEGRDGAGDGSRTRDIQLGRLTLCQLSYSRPPIVSFVLSESA